MSASASRACTETTVAPLACCTAENRHRQQAEGRLRRADRRRRHKSLVWCGDAQTCRTPFTNLCPLLQRATWPVAAAADCLPHGPARGSPQADVLPPLDAIPVALPSAVQEVARSPARRPEAAPLAGLATWMRRPAVVDSAEGLGLASAVALHPAAGSVAADSAVGHLAGP